MNWGLALSIVLSFILCPSYLFADQGKAETRGESLFRIHCSACHPEGGNILNPSKTLFKKDREANNILSPEDIVKKMRNPEAFSAHPSKWSGMKLFDEKSISDNDAREIAVYILGTFK